MKKLLQKSALFFLILILIKTTFVVFFNDRLTYREPEFTRQELRHQIFEAINRQLAYRKSEITKQDFNTVFFGSSRTNYSVVPPYFDALTQNRTKSYNFGINAGFPPQTF